MRFSMDWLLGRTPEQRERKQRARERWHEIKTTDNAAIRAGRKLRGPKRERGWFFFWWS